MSANKIIEQAFEIYEESERQIKQYIEFEEYITPLVRSKFNLPKFNLQYRYMVSVEVQKFIDEQEQLFYN